MSTTARWHHVAPGVCGTLAVVTTATTFGPWGRSGRRVRTSYGLVDVAERAGVLAPRMADLSVVWLFAPALCGVVLVAFALRHNAMGYVATVTLGALVATGGVLVARSPLVLQSGAAFGIATGCCAMLVGTAALVTITMRRTR